MAFKLNKTGQTQRTVLIGKLRQAEEDVTDSVMAYNTILQEIEQLRDEVVADFSEQIEAKSDKWQESDAGEAATSLRDDWENLNTEEIQSPDMGHADALEQLADSV